MTTEKLQALLDAMDDGVLKYGAHKAGGRDFCALEFESQVRGRAWSDAPGTIPDIRPLNDAFGKGAVADKARTAALLPLMAVLWDWSTWTTTRKQHFVEHLVITTVQRTIAELSGLPEAIKRQCMAVVTLKDAAAVVDNDAAAHYAADAVAAARYAAHYAADAVAAARYAADAADAAADAAAADAARYAAAAAAAAAANAADARLKSATLSCQIWLEAAESSRKVSDAD